MLAAAWLSSGCALVDDSNPFHPAIHPNAYADYENFKDVCEDGTALNGGGDQLVSIAKQMKADALGEGLDCSSMKIFCSTVDDWITGGVTRREGSDCTQLK